MDDGLGAGDRPSCDDAALRFEREADTALAALVDLLFAIGLSRLLEPSAGKVRLDRTTE
jgi:hypothetical protein